MRGGIRIFITIFLILVPATLLSAETQVQNFLIKDMDELSGDWWGDTEEVQSQEKAFLDGGMAAADFTGFAEEKYQIDIVAYTGQDVSGPSTISSLGWGPSINDSSQVAFKAAIEDGREAIFVEDGQTLKEISFLSNSFYYSLGTQVYDVNRNYWFGDAVQINNQGQVVWRADPKDAEIDV